MKCANVEDDLMYMESRRDGAHLKPNNWEPASRDCKTNSQITVGKHRKEICNKIMTNSNTSFNFTIVTLMVACR